MSTWWMPFQAPAAPAAQRSLRLLDRTETFDLGEARVNKVYYMSGIGLTVEVCTGTVQLRFNDPRSQLITLAAGNSYPHIEFSRIYLTNAAQADDTLTIRIRTPADSYFGPQLTSMREYGIDRGTDNTVVATVAAVYTTIKTIYVVNTNVNTIITEVAFEYRVNGASLGDMRIQIDIDGGGYNTIAEVNNFNNVAYLWYRLAFAATYGNVVTVIVQARNNAAVQTANRGMRIYGVDVQEIYNF